MKFRTLAGLAILSLAAWLPLTAQQTGAQSAAPQTSQAATAAEGGGKTAAKPDCPMMQKDNATSATQGSQGMSCCHDKTGNSSKASCCKDKDAKQMSCCAQQGQSGNSKSAAGCCQGMKDGHCAATGGKDCCAHMNAKNSKDCCTGMSGHCPAPAQGK